MQLGGDLIGRRQSGKNERLTLASEDTKPPRVRATCMHTTNRVGVAGSCCNLPAESSAGSWQTIPTCKSCCSWHAGLRLVTTEQALRIGVNVGPSISSFLVLYRFRALLSLHRCWALRCSYPALIHPDGCRPSSRGACTCAADLLHTIHCQRWPTGTGRWTGINNSWPSCITNFPGSCLTTCKPRESRHLGAS